MTLAEVITALLHAREGVSGRGNLQLNAPGGVLAGPRNPGSVAGPIKPVQGVNTTYGSLMQRDFNPQQRLQSTGIDLNPIQLGAAVGLPSYQRSSYAPPIGDQSIDVRALNTSGAYGRPGPGVPLTDERMPVGTILDRGPRETTLISAPVNMGDLGGESEMLNRSRVMQDVILDLINRTRQVGYQR